VIPHTRDHCHLGLLTVLAAAALWAVPSFAATEMDISIRPAHEAPVELLRPADGEILVGGREATVAWRALRELPDDGIHEWEAFLSFDGGRYWPVRITPHLDIGLSSFRFEVPPIESDDVRLMLRFGDERRELGYILPHALRSVVPVGVWTPPPAPASGPGEAAHSGVLGVVLWAEGERDGRHVEMRSSSWASPGVLATRVNPIGTRPVLATTERRTSDSATARPQRTAPAGLAHRPPLPVHATVLSLPLPLLTCRQNE
jgi:hypothetical protein